MRYKLGHMPNFSAYSLSILYLRCTFGHTVASRRKESFNSLFEMPQYPSRRSSPCRLRSLSILYLRCSYADRGRPEETRCTFNSLFEMRDVGFGFSRSANALLLSILYLRCQPLGVYVHSDPLPAFNSLFEMRVFAPLDELADCIYFQFSI